MSDKAEKERDVVLRRMLKTPPKPHEPIGKREKQDESEQKREKKPAK